MKNVFVAIGGSGAKVAEALIRLLAIGCPTRRDDKLSDGSVGVLTSAGDSLQIWRVDPDLSSGAAVELQACLKDYAELQGHLNGGHASGVASSRWAMDVDTRLRNLNPLQLPRAASTDNDLKTLRGVLDSRYSGIKNSSLPVLFPFYAEKDLNVEIDRGFYQKPFIGAAVMAVFANSLGDESSPGGKECSLTAFHNNAANFFLCGSLHGGTGACGVPVIGRFLGKRKKQNTHWNWRIGACLLAPYCVPPQPPFAKVKEGVEVTDDLIDEMLRRHADDPAFAHLKQDEEKRPLIRQILNGFYADPDDMEKRARQGLAYYKDHSADYFDELYLVGKPEPDKLHTWSNGGTSQRNPLNSAETVAALAALNFFAQANTGDPQSYVIGASRPDLSSQQMRLGHLPRYKINGGEATVDAERVFLATATLHHLLLHQIPWDKPSKTWSGFEALRRHYAGNETKQPEDRVHYIRTMEMLTKFIAALLDPRASIGWNGEDFARLSVFLTNEGASEISARMAKKGFFGKEARDFLVLGESALKASTLEFGEWKPPVDSFTRGEYLRYVWGHLFDRAKNKA